MKRIKETALLFLGLGFVVFVFYFTEIGCPIKWVTGISCAGCGLTRACLAALQLRFSAAFSYHPLFWLVPVVLVLYLIRERLPVWLRESLLWGCVAAFLIAYVIRLTDPSDAIVVADPSSGLIARAIHFISSWRI